jgi:hypothetical protein
MENNFIAVVTSYWSPISKSNKLDKIIHFLDIDKAKRFMANSDFDTKLLTASDESELKVKLTEYINTLS